MCGKLKWHNIYVLIWNESLGWKEMNVWEGTNSEIDVSESK
jgi:hypothetical protein